MPPVGSPSSQPSEDWPGLSPSLSAVCSGPFVVGCCDDLAYELFENGEIDACGEALDAIVKNLNEVVDNYNQEIYTNTFLKFHGKKIGEMMQKLGQKKLLQEMIYLDSQRDNIYKELLSSI